jgi:hypothetical protein
MISPFFIYQGLMLIKKPLRLHEAANNLTKQISVLLQ